VLRLRPCEIVARVAPIAERSNAAFEVELARRLAQTESPVATLDRRVRPQIYVHDGFVVTLWTYYESTQPQQIAAAEYAHTLERLHAGMRHVEPATPHFTDRVAHAQRLVESRDQTPELPDADRDLLSNTLPSLRQKVGERTRMEQLLHGEPHPGNLLRTSEGLLLIDLETACRGPVEFDIAHAPQEVSKHYAYADQGLVRECRILALAIAITWRWEPGDQLPNGRRLALIWLNELRAALER
jgi:thiamine kinase-like enzyme